MITQEFGGTIIVKVANDVGTTERFILSFENAVHFVEDAEAFLRKSGLDDPKRWVGTDSLEEPQKAFARFKSLMPEMSKRELNTVDPHEVKNKFAFGIEEQMQPQTQLITIQTADADDRVQVFLCTPTVHFMLIDQIKIAVGRLSKIRH
jgi:hypothetical protein